MGIQIIHCISLQKLNFIQISDIISVQAMLDVWRMIFWNIMRYLSHGKHCGWSDLNFPCYQPSLKCVLITTFINSYKHSDVARSHVMSPHLLDNISFVSNHKFDKIIFKQLDIDLLSFHCQELSKYSWSQCKEILIVLELKLNHYFWEKEKIQLNFCLSLDFRSIFIYHAQKCWNWSMTVKKYHVNYVSCWDLRLLLMNFQITPKVLRTPWAWKVSKWNKYKHCQMMIS